MTRRLKTVGDVIELMGGPGNAELAGVDPGPHTPPVPATEGGESQPQVEGTVYEGVRRSQSHHIEAQCLADVEAEEVAFLWRPRLPRGKLTILEGDPGQGKSYIVAAIATALSLGKGLPGMGEFEPVSSLIFTAEDGLADTLRPRLEAMGADLSRVFAYDQAVDLSGPQGIEAIGSEVARLRPAMVAVDPIVAYLGGRIDMHRANSIRSILAPLSQLAGSYSCAVVAVLHLSKARSGRVLHAGLGSVDFSAAARSILLAGSSANDPKARALLHIKCNVAEQAPALGFSILGGQFGWTGPSTLAAADLLGPETAGEQRTAEEEAARWLEQLLSDEPMRSREVRREADAAGLGWRTVERAKRRLGVRVKRVGFGEAGAWEWMLPDQRPPNNIIGRQANSLAGNGEPGGLCDGAAPDKPIRKVDL